MAAIGILGPLTVDGDAGALPPRERVVLAVLAVRSGEVVSAETLADAWWGERLPPTWPKAMQGCILRLRKVLGAAAIETGSGGYRLVVPIDEIDAQRFVRHLARARELLALGEPDRAAYVVDEALGLWHGGALVDVQEWEPGRVEAQRLGELRLDAQEVRIDAALRSGRHRDVLAEAQTRVAEAPLREHRWVQLALAQYQAGRQGDALRTLRQAREVLLHELGLDPGPDIVTLELAILRQDPSLVAARLPDPSPVCPYLGLVPYDVDDADIFFGRDVDVSECVRRLTDKGVLAVVGPSGSGKSSLVRAGVAAALKRDGHRVVIITPGAHPIEALTAIGSDGRSAVLVVDQCEEAVALCRNGAEQARFFAALAEHAGTGDLVVALRADRLGELAAYPAFARVVERGLFLLKGMEEPDLRAAIQGPARQAGLLLEPGLVDLLVRDVEGEPGALPLLSHALRQSWQRREYRTMTVASYQASGGIRGSVAQSAEQVYEQAPTELRPVLRNLLLRLVTRSPEGEPVRGRVPRRALATDADHEEMIEQLVVARLVTSDEDVLELAHEAIARAWPRLRGWLDDDADGQRIWRHLTVSASSWEAMGQPVSELYRGTRLAQTTEWRDHTGVDLNTTERTFLDASQHHADAERTAVRRRRRAATGLIVAAAVVALLLGAVAVSQARRASAERDRALASDGDARLEALVNQSLALRSTDRAVAALLAAEAHRRAPDDPRARSALLGTFTAAPGFLGYTHLPAASLPLAGQLVPGGSVAVVAGAANDLQLLNLETGRFVRRFAALGTDDAVPTSPADSTLRVSRDGRYVAQLVTSRADRPCTDLDALGAIGDSGCAAVLAYDITSGERVLGPLAAPFYPDDLALDGDGSLIAVAGGDDGSVAVYRTADSRLVGVIAGARRPPGDTPARATATVAFGADGRLYAGSVGGPVRVIDASTAEVVGTIAVPALSTNVNLIATDDGTLVAGGDETLVRIDISASAVRWTADILTQSDPSPCTALAVAETMGRMYCGNQFGVLAERDLTTGQLTGVRLDPQTGSVGDLVVTADGTSLVSFGADSPVITRWRLDGHGPIMIGSADGVLAERYDPSGELLVVVESEHPEQLDAAVWEPAGGTVVDDLAGIDRIPVWVGNRLLGAAFDDGTIGFYDIDDRARVGRLDSAAQALGSPAGASVSAAGTRIYLTYVLAQEASGPRCEVHGLDVESGRLAGPTIDIDGCRWVGSVSATDDASRIAITYETPANSVTVVHDGQSGRQLGGPVVGHLTSTISPDGTLVGGGITGEITQYDLDTLVPIGTYPGARGAIDQLWFSADGSVLLVESRNQILSIYDAASRTRLGDPIVTDAPFDGPKGTLRPDGNAVAINTGDGFTIWDLDPDNLAAAACRLAGRNLTQAEWNSYIGPGERGATCPADS